MTPDASARLLALATKAARSNHAWGCVGNSGKEHRGTFELCLHPDCALVRSPAPRGEPPVVFSTHTVDTFTAGQSNVSGNLSSLAMLPPLAAPSLGRAQTDQIGIRDLQRVDAQRAKRWHPKKEQEWTPLETAGAMCGEAGEAANYAKKLKRVMTDMQNVDGRGNHSADDYRRGVAKECADTVIYAALLCESVGQDLQDAIVEVFNAKSDEYGFPERLAPRPLPPGASHE